MYSANSTAFPNIRRITGLILAVVLAATGLMVATAQEASAQTGGSAGLSSAFCANYSLGGPRMFPFDSDGDGVADNCSLPYTRREAIARQFAMRKLIADLNPQEFAAALARACASLRDQTFGDDSPQDLANDACVTGVIAPLPPPPANPQRFFSGPVINGPEYCANFSLEQGGPQMFPLDTNGDGVADICSLPYTRREAIARQLALEELAKRYPEDINGNLASACADLADRRFVDNPRDLAEDACSKPPPPPATAPGAPTGIVTEPGNRQITITWTAPPENGAPITAYTVAHKTNTISCPTEDPDPTWTLQTTTDATASITNLTNGTIHRLCLRATNSEGDSNWTTTTATPADVPGAPTNIVTTVGNRQITITWATPADNGAPITAYTVARKPNAVTCPTGDPDTTWTLQTATDATAGITNLTNGITYRLCVRATNAMGDGPWATAAAVPAAVPGTPTGIITNPGNRQITITWTAPADNGSPITAYTIERCTTASGSCTSSWTNSGTTATTSHTITGLENGAVYGIRIRATNAHGDGEWSATVLGNTVAFPPEAPSGLTAKVGDRHLTLTWTAPADNGSPITSYTVECRLADTGTTAGNCNQSTWSSYTTDTGTSVTVTGLNNGLTYGLRVKATNAMGDSPWSTTTATVSAVPGAPINPRAVTSGRNISVTWTAPPSGGSPITSYTVEYCTGSCTSWSSTTVTGSPPATTATLTGLSTGSSYTIRVRAGNVVGDGAWSVRTSATTPGLPEKPTNLSISSWSAGQMTVGWTASTSSGLSAATGYNLQRCAARTNTDGTWSCSSSWSSAGSASGTTHVITGLSGGTAYNVRVQAVNAAGSSGWSNIATATTDAASAPDDPSGLTATAANRQITVRWTAPADNGARITRYTVQCKGATTQTSGNCRSTTWAQHRTTSSTSLTISSLTNDNQYSIRVRATNSVDNSGWSNVAKATPATTPGTPTNLKLTETTSGGSSLEANWVEPADNGADITAYTLEFRSRNNGWSLAYVGKPTNFTLSNLSRGTTYDVRVRATNKHGDSNWVQASYTMPRGPGQPTGLSLIAGAGQITASWTAPTYTGESAISGYTVQRCTATTTANNQGEYSCRSSWSRAGTTTAGTTQLAITSLSAGTRYGVRVQATNAAGGGSWSSTEFDTTDAASAPGDPTGLTATPANRQITVKWTAPDDDGGARITRYTVQCKGATAQTSGNCQGTDWARHRTTSSTSLTISSLTNDNQYSIRVRATNSVDNSGWSNVAKATPATTPGTPTDLTFAENQDDGGYTLEVSWTAPDNNGANITGYQLEYKPRNSGGWSFANFGKPTSYTLTNLRRGTTYDVRVKATNSIGDSNWVQGSATITGRPGKPTGLSLTAGAGQITASWTAPTYTGGSAITSYNIQRCTARTKDDGTFSSCQTSWVNVRTVTTANGDVTGLTDGTKYAVRVQAANANGSSPWSDVDVATPTGG